MPRSGADMKLNPRKIPRSEEDVKRAREEGIKSGSDTTSVIFLTVLLDHFGFDQEKIISVYNAVMKLSEEIAEKRVSIADLRHVLLKEYHIKA